ncbi:outer membrane protein assembly factor BamD [Oceanibaculum pacificum]|uniref:Outer membrane protein assembly factor BamD n=1 Tax=Oceanibaculum pacificum TaxID=580166 RepID=A0A154W0N2_9PROT|nr:outer membrane protein assembly factor BamD [Oceanibaculum pacificum]KZD07013.1 transporter [Oceanibaculum pacificum]
MILPSRALRYAALAAFGLLAACSSGDEEVPYVERPAEQIYNEAMDDMLARDFFYATSQFEEVERQHPYSVWATKAQLMAAYSYYQQNKYDDAIGALNRFIDLNPANQDIAYAYYLKALCYYEQIVDVGRDQQVTQNALTALDDVVKRFPNSKYSRDAQLKIDLAHDHLAGKEMEIGRYYLKRGFHLAAINRFRKVVDEYQTTTHVPEALHRLTEAYYALGLTAEAEKTAAVLGHNFPGSDWYQDSYANVAGGDYAEGAFQKSWFRRTLDIF